MKKLILDLDSSICDFMSPWLLWIHRKGLSKVHHEVEDVKTYSWIIDKFGTQTYDFFLEDPVECYDNYVPAFPGAKEFVEWCCEHFDTEIVTHSSKKETEIAKTRWVREHLGFDRIRFFPVLEDKFASIKGAILFDDYFLHICKHNSRNGCPGVLFNYNNSNGWGNVEDYGLLLQEEELFDYSRFRKASNYEEAKRAIMELA